ncbi:TRAP-type C4-dicarboxylate transport system substrate-binding protein [Bradyrhizobium barranii subsp. barranii]
MKKNLVRAVAALALSLPVSTMSAQAQAQALELKVADSFPAGHYLVRLMLKPWMDDVTKRTNGAVTFTYYPNQQIGKAADMLRLTQSGVVDIGYIGPSYVSDKMPLSEVAQLPGAFATSCQGTLAYWKTAREGILAKQEYAPNKIKLLLAVVLPPYQVWTVKSKVETTKDMQGLKLRTTGGAQDLTLRALSAVPVRMAAPDAYESLSRGTMDGLLFPLDSVVSYGLDKLVKHATEGVSFGSFIVAYSINQSVLGQAARRREEGDERGFGGDYAASLRRRRKGRRSHQEANAGRRHQFRSAARGDAHRDQGQAQGRRQGVGERARQPRQAGVRRAEGVRRSARRWRRQVKRRVVRHPTRRRER